MTLAHFLVGVSLGVILGVALLLVGGITWQPSAPACPHCAVLTHPYGGCNEAVVGGWICP
jgi:hypothetical protein